MPRFRRSAIAAWALAAGALALLFARAWRIDYPYSIDFQTYWLAGARVIDGRAADLYAAGGGPADGTPAAMGAGEFKNLPIVAAAFAPFGLLDYATAKRTFWWLSLLSLAGTAWLLGRFVLPVEIGSTASRCALAFAPLAAMAPAHIALRHGQTTPLVALALAGSLAATVRRRPAPAGVALAVACLVKFPPLAIVPLDLARRRLRAAAVCAAAIAAVVVASIAAFGPPLHRAYLAGIAEQAGRVMPAHNNQSLAATATRLSHRVEPSAWTPRPLPRDAAIATAIGAAALLAAVAAGVAGKGRRVEAEHAAVLAAGILLLPVAWDHYFLMLAPAAIALAGVLWARGALARPGFLAAAATGAALLGLPTPARLLEGGPSPLPVAIVLSHYFAGALVLLGLAVASLRTADA